MIYAFIRGRLGNQFFQYAFVRALQEINPNQQVVYIFDEVYKSGKAADGWENVLQYFNTVNVNEVSDISVNLSLQQKVMMKLYWKKFPHNVSIQEKHNYQIKWLPGMEKVGLYYLDLGYYPFAKTLPQKNIIISGNFESPKYFENIKDKLRRELTPKSPVKEQNRWLLDKILNTQSVCVSIRRGDFISDRETSTLLNVCTKVYFERAIEKMKELVPDLTLFFFSDDIAWAKENLQFGAECYYESGTDPVWEKLRLMYSCKHFIISNSTFSWWAQYLGNDSEKKVIAPARWYNSTFEPALIQKEWIKIEVD